MTDAPLLALVASQAGHRFSLKRSQSPAYLYGRLLERLGVINTNVHLSTSEFWDFRDAKLEGIIAEPDDYRCGVPIEATADLLDEGQFAVAHLDRKAETEASLRGLVHMSCIRDLRDVLISHMRFILDPRRRARTNGDWWKASGRSEIFDGYLRGSGG